MFFLDFPCRAVQPHVILRGTEFRFILLFCENPPAGKPDRGKAFLAAACAVAVLHSDSCNSALQTGFQALPDEIPCEFLRTAGSGEAEIGMITGFCPFAVDQAIVFRMFRAVFFPWQVTVQIVTFVIIVCEAEAFPRSLFCIGGIGFQAQAEVFRARVIVVIAVVDSPCPLLYHRLFCIVCPSDCEIPHGSENAVHSGSKGGPDDISVFFQKVVNREYASCGASSEQIQPVIIHADGEAFRIFQEMEIIRVFAFCERTPDMDIVFCSRRSMGNIESASGDFFHPVGQLLRGKELRQRRLFRQNDHRLGDAVSGDSHLGSE